MSEGGSLFPKLTEMKGHAIQEAVGAIERGLVPKFLPSLMDFMRGRNLEIEEDPEIFFKGVLEVVSKRTEEGVRAFFQSLGCPSPLRWRSACEKGVGCACNTRV